MSDSHNGPDDDLTPDPAQMVAFCEWWFGATNRGVLEIGWIDAIKGNLTEFMQFERDDLQSLAAMATQVNMVNGQSCYIRAATVRPHPFPPYTEDTDFVQAPGIWSDIDKAEDVERARTVQTMVRPNASVITGTVPNLRVQSWFRASEPIVSGTMVRDLNVRLHNLYGGDEKVVNPSRLMRLPGTIAWPRKPGRVAELVRFLRPAPDDKRPDSYPLSLFTSQLPAATQYTNGHDKNGTAFDFGTGPQAGAFGGLSTVSMHIAAIKAGREWHNHVTQLTAHWVGRGMSTAEIIGHAADWTLSGYTIQQSRAEILKAIEGARRKWNVPDVDAPIGPDQPKGLEILSLAELDALPPPKWLVHGLVPERSLIVPYGPPKAGKTFVILSLGLHIAADRPWFGHPVQGGGVAYIAGEGTGGLSLRLRAMRAKYEIGTDVPFWIIPRAVNLRVTAEINALEMAVRRVIGTTPLRLLVVDTLARAMPGADENSAQEVGSVIAAADYLKEAFKTTVALIHHEGKDGERGARGTSALRGAWDAAYQITGNGKQSKLTVVDQKDAEAGQVLSFVMEEVAVGIGRTSLVPVLDESPSPESERRREIGGQTGIALQVLRDSLAGPDAAILPWFSGRPTGDISGLHVETWRRHFYEKMPTMTQDARKKAFQRSVENLVRAHAIGVHDPWVWLGKQNETGHGTYGT